jgi:hypothetical protein
MSVALCRKITVTSGVTTIRTRLSSCREDVSASGWTSQRMNLAMASGKNMPFDEEIKDSACSSEIGLSMPRR